MQELSTDELDHVSGGGTITDGIVIGVSLKLIEAAANALGSFASAGQAPNWGKTTAMGDMY
jgi:bacteriocin-like protein